MLIAFAFSFIGVLLVYGNYFFLRNPKVLLLAFILSIALAVFGIYWIITSKMENPFFLMALISPLAALLLLQLARGMFRRIWKQEIILYMGGFLPKRYEERFVTRLERMATFVITVLALALAYFIVLIVE